MLFRSQTIIIGAVPTEPDAKGVLHETWDGTWFTVSDGKNQVICPVTGFEEIDPGKDEYMVEIPAQVMFRGGKQWRDITLYFLLDFKEADATGHFVAAFETVKNQTREVEFEVGDSVRPVFVSVDNNGNEKDIASSHPDDILHITKADDLEVGKAELCSDVDRLRNKGTHHDLHQLGFGWHFVRGLSRAGLISHIIYLFT